LAERNQTMIAEYREDIGQRRLAVTAISRGGPGLILDVVDAVRGPIPAGEPARAEQARQEKRALQFSDPEHPAHGMFRAARVGVYAQDAKFGRMPDAASDRLAGALVAEIYALGGTQIDRVVVSKDGTRMFAVQGRLGELANVYASVDVVEGLNTPLAQSSERVAQCAVPVPQQPVMLMKPRPELQPDASQQTWSPALGGRGL
ncbi:XVIPCD domain-containing protein, partial [Stenotrophomonas sp. C3(2023)]|uniref:XVIPCD domain-containing protein n=1 Tax=Stenotrophomonas sp. C3(2023) TaxID=3080277 RepID=UPI00293F76F0